MPSKKPIKKSAKKSAPRPRRKTSDGPREGDSFRSKPSDSVRQMILVIRTPWRDITLEEWDKYVESLGPGLQLEYAMTPEAWERKISPPPPART